MNFAQLKFVCSVNKQGSFSRAAQACHVTQPTLSNAILKLEDELGHKIFERSTRKVSTTKFGLFLIPQIASLIEQQSNIIESAKNFYQETKLAYRVGVSPLINHAYLSDIIKWIKQQNINYEIILTEENLSVLERLLNENKLDIILIPKLKAVANFESLPLYQECLYFIDAEEITKPNVELKSIRDKSYIMVPDICGLSDITRNLIRTANSELRESKGKALSYQVLCEWAENGMGAAILPESKTNSALYKQKITQSGTPVKMTFDIRWLKENKNKLEKLLELIVVYSNNNPLKL